MTKHDNATYFWSVTQPGNPWLRRPTWSDALRWAVLVVRTRAALAEMDTRMLADIGLSRGEGLQEARRKPWDLLPALDRARRRSGLPAASRQREDMAR